MATVRTMMLADQAMVSDNKLFIHGGLIGTLTAEMLPTVQTIFVAGALAFDPGDYDSVHVLTIECRYADDDEVLARVQNEFRLPEMPEGLDPIFPEGLNISLPLTLQFRRAGVYRVSLALDGETLDDLPFKVQSKLPTV